MLSVIIPNWNCPYASQTIADILNKAKGEIEVIVTVSEHWPDPVIEDKRVKYIHPGSIKGMRFNINCAAALASGKYLLKTDDHCLFEEGFDEILIANHLEDNWVTIPRRYSLDAQNWKRDESRPFRDYHYLSFPAKDDPRSGLRGMEWNELTRQRTDSKYAIDDLMSFQGSCWFMTKNHFANFLGGMNEEEYGKFAQESQEIGLKTWLGGGRVVVNKKTWYAHFHKNSQYAKKYPARPPDKADLQKGYNFTVDHWLNNKWKERKHDFDWLIDKFWPVPGWPPNWKDILYKQ